MSKITVTTIAGATSGADANKVKIESGDTLESSTIGTASGAMSIKPAGTEVVNIGTTGDILVKGTSNQRAALLLRAGSNTANSQIQLGDQASDSSGRIMYDHSDDTMRFNTNGSERVRISAAGLAIGGTGAANTLDDYEEGTWTPILTGYGGGNTQTYQFQTGNYTKIGRLVTAHYSVRLTAKGNISGNYVHLQGMPFANLSTNTGSGMIHYVWSTGTSRDNLHWELGGGNTDRCWLTYLDSTTTGYVNTSELGNTTGFAGTLVYITDA